jgi:hypothetical protein
MKINRALATGLFSAAAIAGLVGPVHGAQAATLKVDKCAVHVNIAHPHARQTETLAVTSTAPGTTVQVKIYYKTVTHTWKFKTPKSTKTTYKFGVGNPTKGYKVNLKAVVTAVPKGYRTGATCSTSFVPA